jgi:N-methylhydantoinase B
MDTATTLDVVSASILRAKLDAVVHDMGTTLANIAHSGRLSTSRAFACAVHDAEGRTAALDAPLHLAPIQESAAACLEAFRFATAADDVIITNDPYGGGSSVHYFTVVAPLGHADDIVAYLVVQAHMIDIGGVVMGNYHPGAWELWAEGARFTPLKLVVDGKTRRDAMDTLLLNGRDPEGFRGDLDAVLATAEIGRERLSTLIHDHGMDDVAAAMAAAIDYAERRFRAELARIPEGRFEGEAVLDHDGQGGRDATVRVALERRGDDLRLDFTGTDAQSAGFVNSPLSNTRSYALLPLMGLVDGSVPCNAGLLEAIEVIAPEGTLVNPAYPAPTGWCRGHVAYEIADAVGQALSRALPEETGLGYASESLVFTVTKRTRIGGVEEQLGVTDYHALSQVGADANAHGDGWGAPGPAAQGMLPSVEEFEADREALVTRLEYRADSGGPGAFRGGLGTETVIRFPEATDERRFACVQGGRHPPAGFADGGVAAAAAVSVAAGGTVADIAEVEQDRPLDGGAELRILTPGGGGWGDPRTRSPERVRADVLDGYVSAEAASAVYGVAEPA